METTLIVKGTLRGVGCEAECSLIATRSDGLNTMTSPAFMKCAVLDAPEWLPDGYYEVMFSGLSAFMHRVNGLWSVGVPWHQVPARRGAAGEREPMLTMPTALPMDALTE